MQYTEEFDVDTFQFWSGARDTVDAIVDADPHKTKDLQLLIEENFVSRIPTKTEINDFVWFNRDMILSSLGIVEDSI